MSYLLQRLDENNLAKIRTLNKLFGDVFEDPESYHSNPPSDTYLIKFLSNPNNIVLVAIDNDEVLEV